MKNNTPKSPADEFEVGKPAPVAAKAEQTTLPATTAPKKTYAPGLPKPTVPTVGGSSPAPKIEKEIKETFPAGLKESLALLTKLQNDPAYDRNKNNALLRRVEALGRHCSKLQQLPAAPSFDADNLQIGLSPKRRRALADKLR